MTDTEFDSALIAAAFRLAAQDGWMRVSVAAACREAGLPLSQARGRFPSRSHVLVRFGRMADQVALQDAPTEGTVRDRLFDLLMRRFDAMNVHRDGLLALLRALPVDPGSAMLLACATRSSMRWMLDATGVPTFGLSGELRVKGLLGVWLWGLRAWERDDTEDLTHTMAAVDQALGRAEWFANMIAGHRDAEAPSPSAFDDAEPDPSDVLPPDVAPIIDPVPDPEEPTDPDH